MAVREGRACVSRFIPAVLLLGLAGGGASVLGAWALARLTETWTTAARTAVFGIAAAGLLWGMKQAAGRSLPAAGSGRGLRLSRHRVMLARAGGMYLVIMSVLFVASLLGRSNLLMLLFALMAGAFVLNGWTTFAMLKRTDVSRRVPRRVMAGEPVSAEVRAANRKRWLSSWLMTVHDRIVHAESEDELDAGVLFARIPPGQRRTAPYQLRLMRRGRYYFGPIHVATRFPMGLVERGVVLDDPEAILVYPRLGRLSARWKRDQLSASQLVQRRELRRGPYEDEFHRIREFRWGDNPRAIHWRTSARHNELMVREYQQNRAPRLVILLDLWQPRSPSAEELDRVERAVSLTATICVDYLRQGHDPKLELIAAGRGRIRWGRDSSDGTPESLLEMLALLRAGEGAELGALFDESAAQRTAGTRTILVTTRSASEQRGAHFPGSGAPQRSLETPTDFQTVHVGEPSLWSFFHLD